MVNILAADVDCEAFYENTCMCWGHRHLDIFFIFFSWIRSWTILVPLVYLSIAFRFLVFPENHSIENEKKEKLKCSVLVFFC